jgi:alpha-beta hydrolase superfamily lysophospholipase
MSLLKIRLPTVIFLLFALAACASPVVIPRGPYVGPPRMTDDAFIMSDGAHLPYRKWSPPAVGGAELAPKAIIIGVHGMNDYSNAFSMPGAFLAQRGILTYAYDQRGFGDAPDRGHWAGTPAMTKDLQEVSELVRARYPDTPIYLMGVSMGGAVILAAEDEHRFLPVDGVILAAPAVWGWQAMNIAYKLVLWTGAHVMPAKTLTGARLQIWPSDNVPMLEAMARDPEVIKKTRIGTIYGLVGLMDRGYDGADKLALPTLLLYGKKDQIVPAAPVMNVAERIPGLSRMLYYTNGYHMLERDLDAKVVWQDIDTWIGDHSAPMPSIAGRAKPLAEELKFTGPHRAAVQQASTQSD